MKHLYIFLTGLLLCSSCAKNILDKNPLDIISEDVVWRDQALIDAYLTNAYLQMPILMNECPYTPSQDYHNGETWNGPFIINEITDESKRNWVYGQANNVKSGGIRINGGVLEWWEGAYTVNRTLNEFIKRLPEAPVQESFKVKRLAEARFLRAYNYFALVKRYGGIPLITQPQTLETPEDELYPARDKEQAIYDFILSETAAIAKDLPEKGAPGYEYGRPVRHTAWALQCRAALYAASIAQFGKVELNGVVGIGATASTYYQKAYDAAKQIMSSSIYGLYNRDADKVMNFRNIFLVKDNIEVIWAQRHDIVNRETGGNGWVWDFFQCPKPHAWNAGNQNAPYLEMAEAFEHTDGSPGTLNRSAIQTGVWRTGDLWADKDPRFYATLYTQNTPWQGGMVDFHNGIRLPDGNIQTDGSYQGVLAKGTQQVDNSFGTGFGVLKYLDESHINMGAPATSSTDFQLFRYAEVLLNFAEAAFELGKPGEALEAVNQVRARAGIAPLLTVNRDRIRQERKVELAFEGHRYWDLRRWRTAQDVLTVNRSGLRYILDYSTRAYKLQVIDKIDGKDADPRFLPENYYLPVTVSRTENNPKLLENPGYK